jgi:hypothetical protein
MKTIVDRLRSPEFADVAERYLMAEAAIEIERLRAVAVVAVALVHECDGGKIEPSLGTLARLESAIHIAWKDCRDWPLETVA